MKTEILEECGFQWAMKGLARSYNQPAEKMPAIALKLGGKGRGHDKFLESITVYLDVEAPRFWWSEMDTYRTGITKQSDSTMHTLKKQPLRQDNFDFPINFDYLCELNRIIEEKYPIEVIKNALPDGFIQGRTICTNYKTLQNIILQRRAHRLPQWKYFCQYLLDNLQYVEYLGIK